jgi:hypothetical protein
MNSIKCNIAFSISIKIRVGRLPLMAISGRNIKNIVALDGIQS